MDEVKRKPPTRSTDPVLGFQLTLNPTKAQEERFYSHVGAVRYTYNWALNLIQQNWEQISAEKKIGEQLTPYLDLAHTPLLKIWTQAKHDLAPWWSENAKQAYDWGILNAVSSYKNFIKSRNGKHKGKPTGYPKFKKRNAEGKFGCLFNGEQLRLNHDTKHVNLPRIGQVKYFGDAGTLKWLLTKGSRITQGVLKQNQTRWTLSFNLRVPPELYNQYINTKYKKDLRVQKQNKKAVGVDVGLKTYAVMSDGFSIENPKFLRSAHKKTRKANKRLSRRSGIGSYRLIKDETTNRDYKQWSNRHEQARKNLAKAHARVVNLRKNQAHQFSNWLVQNYDYIGIETLNISGMVRNKKLAHVISDAAWGQTLSFLSYKCERSGVNLGKIYRFAPSSKTCSECGAVKTKLSLNERTYKCSACGTNLDRDLNAAINIARWSLKDLTEVERSRYSLNLGNEVRESLDPWVTGETKIGQTGAYRAAIITSAHRNRPSSQEESMLSSQSNLAMLKTSTL